MNFFKKKKSSILPTRTTYPDKEHQSIEHCVGSPEFVMWSPGNDKNKEESFYGADMTPSMDVSLAVFFVCVCGSVEGVCSPAVAAIFIQQPTPPVVHWMLVAFVCSVTKFYIFSFMQFFCSYR